MRKWGVVAIVIVVLLVAAALIVPHLIDVNQYHGQIQAQLQKRLGRDVSLGDMSLRLFPPAFRVNNATIAEDSHFGTSRPFASVEKLDVHVKFWPLLHKDLQVESLELTRPQIELIRNAQGAWNFATLGQEAKPAPENQPEAKSKPESKPAPATPSEPEAKAPAGKLTLANLFISDGQVAITDLQKHQSRAVYDHIDLNLSNFSPNEQFDMKLTAHLPGAGKQAVMLQGKGRPLKEADLINTPFDGTLRLDQVATGSVQKFLNSQSLNGIDAVISGDAKVKNTGGKLASSGTINLENARVHSTNVGYPITHYYDVDDELSNYAIQIHKGDLQLGSTPVTIAGTINSKPTPATIDLKLTAKDASIAEAARLASAFGVAFGQGTDVKGTVNANIQAHGPMTKPAMNGQLSASNLEVSGKELPQPV